jgi:hypothetical protein
MKTSAIKHKTFFIMGFLKVNIHRSSDASSNAAHARVKRL